MGFGLPLAFEGKGNQPCEVTDSFFEIPQMCSFQTSEGTCIFVVFFLLRGGEGSQPLSPPPPQWSYTGHANGPSTCAAGWVDHNKFASKWATKMDVFTLAQPKGRPLQERLAHGNPHKKGTQILCIRDVRTQSKLSKRFNRA